MTIVPATTRTQLEIVQKIAHQSWPIAYGAILSTAQITYMLDTLYNLDTLQEQSTTKQQHFLLAYNGKSYEGFASYALNYPHERSAKIHKLYLLPSAQGKGVGQRLVHLVEKIAVAEGQRRTLLNVNKYNPALGFYEKMGYTTVQEEKLPIGPYWMDDFVMEKAL